MKKEAEMEIAIYAKLKAADLTANGDLVLELEKENKFVASSLCKLLREELVGRDVHIIITALRRQSKLEQQEEEME